MSGGAFDYKQHNINDILDAIQLVIDQNKTVPKTSEDSCDKFLCNNFPASVIERFERAVITLRQAYGMAHEIDYLISGDTGPESFLERWAEKNLDVNCPQCTKEKPTPNAE